MKTAQFYRELVSEFAVMGRVTALDCQIAAESVLSRNNTDLTELKEDVVLC